ncbi:GNAT family N-acetyltransferase [Novosphingobium sp. NBM11]|uniref:GNAT family N-acetyltransferase n=1 Tax=Novosphingobium sp. NBM11 TaxID=2596914 RepID=UPI001892753F|nr:GNAT family N-acetyltransferase [Novosphingobium sp. NBM11]MBF5089709.1 GNAT family N-acetyltransferase [Novosphingobium sp. NBM11]
MFIRSERLFLRPGWPEDWAELLALIDDESVVRNLARAPWPYSPADARAFASQPQARRHPHFFVTLPGATGAKLIGCVGLADQDGGAELGYWIARQHWGRGYATEAVRAVLALAPTLGHRRLGAHHFLDNPASGRVLAKAGFVPTGDVRPRFSLARRGAAPSAAYVLHLAAPVNGGSEGGDAGDSIEVMRAA